MSGFAHVLGKEFTEIRRTWRLPTVLGVLVFFAIMSPLAAKATPWLVSSVTTSQPGVVIQIPEPTYVDSYVQWIKNLAQMGVLLVVFASAGLIANERSSGTAALVVTKPVSRSAFSVAKYVAQALLVAASTVIGTLVVLAGTWAIFGEAPLEGIVAASAAWLVAALFAISLTLALSAAFPTIAAGIGGLAVWWVLGGLLSLWEPAVTYSPVGLLSAPTDLLAGNDVALGWPLATAALLIVAFVGLAGAIFSWREL
jgi:ABC-2 type transport system permease protein